MLALIAEVPYDLATSGKPFDFGSQNPVFGLFIAFAMLAAMKWVAQRYQGAMLVISDIVLVVVAVLWDLLLRVGLRQHLMSLGAVTLGFVLIFWLMRSREKHHDVHGRSVRCGDDDCAWRRCCIRALLQWQTRIQTFMD